MMLVWQLLSKVAVLPSDADTYKPLITIGLIGGALLLCVSAILIIRSRK